MLPGVGDAGTERSAWQAAYAEARRAWPAVTLGYQVFAAHVEGFVTPGPPDIAHAAELFLACACGQGDARALAMLEDSYLTPARGFLLRLDRRPEFIDEVIQELRTRLLLGERRRILHYGGRGPLIAWLRIAATRIAIDLLRAAKPAGVETSEVEELPQADLGPEVQMLREAYRDLFAEALSASVGELSVADRTLLRRHMVDKLTLEEIARPYGVHPATIARRLAGIREEISESVRLRLAAGHRDHGGATSLESVAQAIRSEVQISLTALLASAPPRTVGG